MNFVTGRERISRKMAAPTLTAKQQHHALRRKKTNKRQSSLKNVLISPYKQSWPLLDESIQKEILEKLKSTFEPLGLQQKKYPSQKMRKDATDDPDAIQRRKLRSQLLFGIGAVTRAVEKDKARLILVSQNVEPAIMTMHLITLCGHRRCAAVCLKNLSTIMLPLLNFTSLVAMGFRKMDETTPFDEFVDFTSHRALEIIPSWLEVKGQGLEEPDCESSKQNRDTFKGGIGTTVTVTDPVTTSMSGCESNSIGKQGSEILAKSNNNQKDYSRFYVYKNQENSFSGEDFIAFSKDSKNVDNCRSELSSLGKRSFGYGTVETFNSQIMEYKKATILVLKKGRMERNKSRNKKKKIK